MANVLVVSGKGGGGLELAKRFTDEGNDVTFFTEMAIVPSSVASCLRVTSSRRHFTGDFDLVAATGSGYGRVLDSIRQRGAIVVAGGTQAEKIELYGSKMIKLLFPDQQFASDKMTIVHQVLLFMLSDKNRFVNDYFVTHPTYRLCDGDRGPAFIGPTGLVTTPCRLSTGASNNEPPPFGPIIEKFVKPLVDLKYTGPICLSIFETKDHSSFFINSLTCHLTFPYYIGMFELVRPKKLYQTLFGISARNTHDLRLRSGVCVGIALTALTSEIESPIFDEAGLKHVHPTGDCYLPYIVTGLGEDVFEARRRARRPIDLGNIPQEIMFRSDINLPKFEESSSEAKPIE